MHEQRTDTYRRPRVHHRKSECPKCRRLLPVASFSSDATKARGHKSWCKDCDNAKSKRYYEANRDRKLAKYHAKPKPIHLCECGNVRHPRQRECKTCAATPLIVRCAHCDGTVVLTTPGRKASLRKYGNAYCDSTCQSQAGVAARAEQARQRRLPVHVPNADLRALRHRAAIALRAAEQPAQYSPRCFYAGECAKCGRAFIARRQSRWCGPKCRPTDREARHNAKQMRRARKRNGVKPGKRAQRVVRSKVYARDGWKCKICGKAVKRDALVPHPLAPTLDHIVPLALGGTHTYENVQLAHFICNSRKGATGAGDQLMLVGHI